MKRFIIGIAAIALIVTCIGVTYNSNKYNSKSDNKTAQDEKNVTVIQAEYPEYDTAQKLVSSSDLVFSGVVQSVESKMLDVSTNKEAGSDASDAQPYTLYTIKVDNVYKGSAESSIITIKVPGGTFGNDQYVMEDAPEILEGTEYLFVTETYEDTYPSLVNATQAVYDMNGTQTMADEDSEKITLSEILALF